MTPDQILASLAVQERLPREAMAAAGARRDEMIPVFLDQIDRLQRARIDTVDEADVSAFLFVYFLLGEWRDARAYRPLTALLQRDPDFVELLIGDAVTEGTARVIAGVCDGDLQPIFEVIAEPAADEFVRGEMIDALIMIARDRPETRSEVTDYLERFHAAEIDKPETLWSSWAVAVADLGLEHLEPQVREAFEQEWIPPDFSDFEFFQRQMRKTVEASEWRSLSLVRNRRLIENAIDELSGWYCFSDEDLKARTQEQTSERAVSEIFGDTFERETPKVGRNDPCPCGSGKKFKKCCLH